jgi:hypothetical protein
MKKAQGLSMTTIVIAALALLVLVILVLIFTGRLKLWGSGVDDAGACDNYCKTFGKIPINGEPIPTDSSTTPPAKKCTQDAHQYIPAVVKKDGGTDYYCCCQAS